MSIVLPIPVDPRFRISTAIGGETALSVPFPFQSIGDIAVTKVALDGTETLLTHGLHYTLSGAEDAGGGTVTLTTPLLAGEKLIRAGVAVLERLTSISREGRFSSAAIDADLDRNRIIQQEQARDIARAPRVPLGSTIGELPAPAALKYWRWDATATTVQYVDLLTSGVLVASAFMQDVLGDADAAAVRDDLNLGTAALLDVPANPVVKLMQPFSYVQGGLLMRRDESFVQNGALWVFENNVDNNLYDGGITSLILSSRSRSTLGQNVVGMVGTIGPGATSIVVTSNGAFLVNKTIAIQLDDGSVFHARITGVAGTTITFTPALGAGQAATSDGSVRQVAVSRAARLTANAIAGATSIVATSIMGTTITGEYIRIELDNGQLHGTTVGGATAPGTMTLDVGLPSAASIGNEVWVGNQDIDPNFVISRKGTLGLNGDIIGGIQFAGPSLNAIDATDVQYAQIAGLIQNSNPGSGYGGELHFQTADGTASGTTATRMALFLGLTMAGATGGDKGSGTINATAVYDDNVLLTCYVIPAAEGGKIDLEYWDSLAPDQVIPPTKLEPAIVVPRIHDGAHKFANRIGTRHDPRTLEGQRAHIADKGHLTPYPSPEKWDPQQGKPVGSWLQCGIEMDELLMLYIMQLEDRLADSEKRIKALEKRA